MKKVLLSILIAVILLMNLTGGAFAAASAKIVEVNDLKIVIDGQLATFKDVPVSVSQYNLLPVRELAVNLGVPNDNEHIKYDPKEKSVTIYKDQTKLYFLIGKKTAYVNDKPVTLDVAPVGYSKNSRTYLPLRFVSESLGKKVIWDGPSRTVFLCDEANYNTTKGVLEKSNAAMKLVSRYNMALDLDCTASQENISMKINMDINAKVDVLLKKMSMDLAIDMLGMNIKTVSYYTGNASYTQDPFSGDWSKQTYQPAEYDKLFNEQSNSGMMEFNEPFYAGLNQVPSDNPDEILLKGDIFLTEALQKALDSEEGSMLAQDGKLEFSKFNVQVSIDADTYLINNMVISAKASQKSEDGDVQTDIGMKISYSDYNGDIQITVPEDVIKNAVEEKAAAF